MTDQISAAPDRVAFAEATLTDKDGRVCVTATSTLLVFEMPTKG